VLLTASRTGHQCVSPVDRYQQLQAGHRPGNPNQSIGYDHNPGRYGDGLQSVLLDQPPFAGQELAIMVERCCDKPDAKHAQHGHTDAEFRGLLYGHGLGSVCGARKRFFYSGGSEGDPIASANGYRPLDAARTIRRVLRSPKDAFKYQ
jgi:hypothetical protein